MARHSDRLFLVTSMIGQALEGIALAAKGANALDAMTLDACVKAYERAAQWRRDNTEASRREAYGAAQAAIALATVPPMGAASPRALLLRKAFAAYGAAVIKMTHHGDVAGALAAASEASTLAKVSPYAAAA